MKIALIQCPVWGTYDPPLALAQLSSCLREAGHEVFVFDLNIELYHRREETYKNMWAWEQCLFWYDALKVSKFFAHNQAVIEGIAQQIIDTGSRLVCFSVSSSSRQSSIELADMLKRKRKDLIIVFGGNLFYQRENISSVLENTKVDIVVPGEGELTACELADFIEKNQDIQSCKGIYSKNNGQIVSSGARPLLANLDVLPFLDFENLPIENYDDSQHIALMASRGCILHCVFCSSREFWQGFRSMSAERVFREVKSHKARHRYLGHVNFLDLLFNANVKNLSAFCDLMVNERFQDPLLWTANAIIRPEMTPELLKKMKRAGCKHLIYGIESGSQRVLNLMRKRFNISDADNVIKATHAAGITVTANFMFGFPGETEEDFAKTKAFLKRNAEYLDRVYPSRTYCAIEEFSYLHAHLEEFGIEPQPPNHLYWQTLDGKNNYPQRLRRCEEFSELASKLGIEVGCGVQTSVELDRWYNLGHYYESRSDYNMALDCFLKYFALDDGNAVISNKIKYYFREIENNNSSFSGINQELKSRLKNLQGTDTLKESCLYEPR